MSVVKKNEYVPGVNSDITNLSVNVDVNRLGMDLTSVEYSSPNFLVKVGSVFEINGNMYAVEGSDSSIAAATGNLVYNESTGFAISSATATYRPDKLGWYLVDGVTRVLRWALTSAGGRSIDMDRAGFVDDVDRSMSGGLTVGGAVSGTTGTFSGVVTLNGAMKTYLFYWPSGTQLGTVHTDVRTYLTGKGLPGIANTIIQVITGASNTFGYSNIDTIISNGGQGGAPVETRFEINGVAVITATSGSTSTLSTGLYAIIGEVI